MEAKTEPPVRPAIRRLRGYVPGEQPPDGARVVKLNTNENPYPPSPRALAAIRDVVGEELRLYPDPTARLLREAAAKRYGVSPEEVLAGNGSDELLALVVRACVEPGQAVAYPVPTYGVYDTLVSVQGAKAETIPFPPDFSLPPGLVGSRAAAIFLCNPNSPSGTWVENARLEALCARAAGVVVVDEAYGDFAPGSAVPLIRRHANVVVLRSFSKSFALAGLRIGLAIAPAPLIAELAKVKDSYNVDRLSIAGAAAALEDCAWMERGVARIRATRARLTEELRALGFTVLPSEANFVLARRGREDLGPLQQALRARGILVRHFPELRDALRITVGSDSDVDTFLEALRDIVRGPAGVSA